MEKTIDRRHPTLKQAAIFVLAALMLVVFFALRSPALGQRGEDDPMQYLPADAAEALVPLPAAAQNGQALAVFVLQGEKAFARTALLPLKTGDKTTTIPLSPGETVYFFALTDKTARQLDIFFTQARVTATKNGYLAENGDDKLELHKYIFGFDLSSPEITLAESHFADSSGTPKETAADDRLLPDDVYRAVFTVTDNVAVDASSLTAVLYPGGLADAGNALPISAKGGAIAPGRQPGEFIATFPLQDILALLPRGAGGEVNFTAMQISLAARDTAGNAAGALAACNVAALAPEGEILPPPAFAAQVLSLTGEYALCYVTDGEQVSLSFRTEHELELGKTQILHGDAVGTSTLSPDDCQLLPPDEPDAEGWYNYTLTYTITGKENFIHGDVYFVLNLVSTAGEQVKLGWGGYAACGIACLYYLPPGGQPDTPALELMQAYSVTGAAAYAKPGDMLLVKIRFGTRGASLQELQASLPAFSVAGQPLTPTGCTPDYAAGAGGVGRYAVWNFYFTLSDSLTPYLQDYATLPFAAAGTVGFMTLELEKEGALVTDLKSANPGWAPGSTDVIFLHPLAAPIVELQTEQGTGAFAPARLDGEEENPMVVTKGNRLYLVITAPHPVLPPTVSIAGGLPLAVQRLDADGCQWRAVYILPAAGLADNTVIPFTVSCRDAAGSVSPQTSQAELPAEKDKVIFFADLQIHDFSLTSSSPADWWKVGDGGSIKASFYTTHPIHVNEALFAGQGMTDVTCKQRETDGQARWYYTVTYTVAGNEVDDRGYFSFAMCLGDSVGQTASLDNSKLPEDQEDKTQNGQVQYCKRFRLVTLQVEGNNAQDAVKYLKNGDTVTVRFTLDAEGIIFLRGRIGSQASTAYQDENGVWVMQQTLNGGIDDLTYLYVMFAVQDSAGNTLRVSMSSVTAGVPRVYVSDDVATPERVPPEDLDVSGVHLPLYYAPITATADIRSGGRNPVYAKNGDTVWLELTANHEVTALPSTLAGRSMGSTPLAQNRLQFSYTIPADERALPEGSLKFALHVTDPAGNKLVLEDADKEKPTKVTYDRTAPVVEISPTFSGFSNKTVVINITYTDKNLAFSRLSLLLNGQEAISEQDRGATRGESYVKTILLSQDGTYTLTARAADRAGNETVLVGGASITVDKTNPHLRRINLSLGAHNTYKGGIRLSDLFIVEEEYLKEIICTLTDTKGVHTWDMDDPIFSEGKKTAVIIAQDLAGNASDVFEFDFYVDDTPPQPLVQELTTGMMLAPGADNTLAGFSATLSLALEDLHIGAEEADFFTLVQLKDAAGNTVAELSSLQKNEAGGYSIPLQEPGSYTLVLQAADSVGNQTPELVYDITFIEPTLLQRWAGNKLLFIGSIALVGALAASAIGGLAVGAMRRSARYKSRMQDLRRQEREE